MDLKKFIIALLKAIAVLLGLAMVSALQVFLLSLYPVICIIIDTFVLFGLLIWMFYDEKDER